MFLIIKKKIPKSNQQRQITSKRCVIKSKFSSTNLTTKIFFECLASIYIHKTKCLFFPLSNMNVNTLYLLFSNLFFNSAICLGHLSLIVPAQPFHFFKQLMVLSNMTVPYRCMFKWFSVYFATESSAQRTFFYVHLSELLGMYPQSDFLVQKFLVQRVCILHCDDLLFKF